MVVEMNIDELINTYVHAALDHLHIVYNVDDLKNRNKNILTTDKNNEFKNLSSAVLLFQAHLEGQAHRLVDKFSVQLNKRDTFKNKWHALLNEAGIERDANFDSYYSNIYEDLRYRITHPGKEKEWLKFLERINFTNVYNGLRCGWNAFSLLHQHFYGMPPLAWEVICILHDLPESLEIDTQLTK